MNVLAIYDSSGTIWAIAQGDDITKPDGIPSVFVNVPNTGCVLEKIDVSDPDHPKPVFSYPAESEVGQLTEKVEKQTQEIEGLRQDIHANDQVVMFAALSFTDQQAVKVPSMYPLWSSLSDGTVLTTQEEAVNGTEVTRVRGDDGKLYKVIKTHSKQSDWAPGQATASLFTVIDVEHAGTKEDPIPASVNMEYFKGKYYIEDGKLYLCTRNSETALQHLPSQLIGHYFELVPTE